MEGDGNGWVEGPAGMKLWGRFGASGLFLQAGGRVLLQHRATWTAQGGTWALPGGARDSHETVEQTAVRETVEECGIDPSLITVTSAMVTAGPFPSGWTYTTVFASTNTGEPIPVEPNEESAELRWVPVDEIRALPLHPGFEASLDAVVGHTKPHD
ncbi:NUDIX domain-containing protein [Corynebacterium sanguinis]|uniref:NUDIX domain-containing protein n=1 Tax=Corynebacterium sanguinis TaxID=2594913 RepID=UPI00223C3DCB|nr:NUDIX hydrolase [Corynebacterium sanguinis]MCT1443705.1 NUDIX hydrolase [Corynebacterium sanguinis]MCT1596893.1 NUDIX hydrolase [Corynebacterium sanguinis]MCT2288882.1 NUDIX hydrolase [Corynebacterium sanguinis]